MAYAGSNNSKLSLLAFSLGLMLPTLAAAQAVPHSEAKTAQMLLQAQEAMQKQDCVTAVPALDYLWGDVSLNTSDPDLANQMRIDRILCALLEGNDTAALALSEKNIARPDANIFSFGAHAILLNASGKSDEAIAALTLGVEKNPDEVSKLAERPLFDLTVQYRDNQAKIIPLFIALEKAQFKPRNGLLNGFMASAHLEALRTTKDPERIKLHRAAISRSPDFYVIMMGDGRLSQADEPLLDIEAMTNTELENSMDYLIENPTDLTSLMSVLSDMIHLNQSVKLVELTKIMIEAVEKDGIDSFGSDFYYNHLLSTHAIALADLGRHSEATQAFEEGYAKLAGRDLTSYMSDYLNYLTDMGDEVRALALLETMDIGSMEIEDSIEIAKIESCAAFYASDMARSDAALSRIPENHIERIKPHLCRGEHDLAAKILIGAMANPESRDDAIGLMQDTKPTIAWSTRDQLLVDHHEALKKRPDVLAAAAKNQILIRTWAIR